MTNRGKDWFPHEVESPNGRYEGLRARIQAVEIIDRLQEHIHSSGGTMNSSQVAAARTLLNRVIPELKAIEMEGPEGSAIQVTFINSYDKA